MSRNMCWYIKYGYISNIYIYIIVIDGSKGLNSSTAFHSMLCDALLFNEK